MVVYVDNARNSYRRMVMCHMVADTPAELHAMARKIGMSRRWYQSPNKASFPHYDLSLTKRRMAIDNGAEAVTSRDLILVVRRIRNELLKARLTWAETDWM